MQILFVGHFPGFCWNRLWTAADLGHGLDGALLQIAKKEPIDRNAEFASDEARGLKSQGPFARFVQIVRAFVDAELGGESGLRLETKLFAQGFQPAGNDLWRVHHGANGTIFPGNCRFASCKPLTSLHRANYVAVHDHVGLRYRCAGRHQGRC